ncbi:MAG: UpxY family transcription antiterminator [Dysgonamonadaceae bacterium]|nr:UpxY family transcription antiterminator [Dysgonamonadaceae bacterium]
MAVQESEEKAEWYVMRDLKRPNAKQPAYKQLGDMRFEVFTPMKWRMAVKQGKRLREKVPFMQDLLFVHDTRGNLDPLVEKMPTLQYRYARGESYRKPMTVPGDEMQRFIHAVSTSDSPKYYLPEEITPEMYRRKIRIVGGSLDGYEGHLLSMRGSKVKRLLVELPNFFSAGVEVNPEYIQFVE